VNEYSNETDDELRQRARSWGIVANYFDTFGKTIETSADSCRALLSAMGVDRADATPPVHPPVKVIRQGESFSLTGPVEVILEGGTKLLVDNSLPHDLPLGYHDLRSRDSETATRLIVCPQSCFHDPALKIWGWSVQLYEVRSQESWGIGDLANLRRLAKWSRDMGAGALLVNPLNAAAPTLPQQPSPYYPSSRRFRNPLYLRIEDVPGAASRAHDLESLATAGRALNSRRLIDRDRVFELKLKALTEIWQDDYHNADFERYCEEQGASLTTYAAYCLLAEQHGGDWRQWKSDYQHPTSPAVTNFAQQHAGRLRFHKWIQWLLDEQLRSAADELPLVQDLPIGFDPGGADAWAWQDQLAKGVSVGAPPDQFNSDGQDWGLPPFVPHQLQAAKYEPFIETIRATLRHARGLRMDHVMGLFRLFWIPQSIGIHHGAYVRYPAEDLLGIVALESHRTQAWVAGEDLGTVEWEVRQRLAEQKMLSYRLLWFERDRPSAYPANALAAVTTHDLPTIAGMWSGTDTKARHARGLADDEQGWKDIRNRLCEIAGLNHHAPIEEAIRALHRALSEAPSQILVATLADALAVHERPNMPGTVEQWPNWQIALPLLQEEIEKAALPRDLAETLAR